MIDVFQVATAMAMVSNCSKCREGGVVVDNDTGNVVSVLKSSCTGNPSICTEEDAKKCFYHVSALGDALVQRESDLKNTSVTVVSDVYPNSTCDAEFKKLLTLLGVTNISYNSINLNFCCAKTTKQKKTKRKSKTQKTKTNKVKSKKIYGTSTCPACGDQFDKLHPSQKYCNHWKIGICEVCGKVFQYKCTDKGKPKTCGSKECVHEIRLRHVMDLAQQRKNAYK